MKKMENPGDKVVYTVGHSNMEIKNFFKLLKMYEIEVLIDVRSVPYSKHVPQFNNGNLQSCLEGVGIEYFYLGNKIGGKPRDERYYRDGKIQYHLIEETESFKEGILRVLELAASLKTVLMCSEENPYKCHRHHLIGQNLLGKGVNVFHLRSDGTIERACMEDVQLKLI